MKELFKSTYIKVALTVIVSGTLLLLILRIITATDFSAVGNVINSTLMPIYIGILLSFLLCPIYNKLVNHIYHYVKDGYKDNLRSIKYARIIASLICVALMAGVIACISYFLIPQIISSVMTIVEVMPDRLDDLQIWTATHLSKYPSIVSSVDSVANAGSEKVVEWIQIHLMNMNIKSVGLQVSSGIFVTLRALISLFIGMLLAIYFLNYKERLFAITRKMITANCTERKADKIYAFGNMVNNTFISYVVGRILDAIIVGIITYVAMTFLGLPFVLIISVIVGVTNIIPFFGPFIGAIPSFCLIFLESPMQAVYFAIMILIIQQVDGNIIGPKIVGSAIGISSFWVILAVLIGGGLFGFLGMALGVPVFAVIYKSIDHFTENKLRNSDKFFETEDYLQYKKFNIEKKEILDDRKNK